MPHRSPTPFEPGRRAPIVAVAIVVVTLLAIAPPSAAQTFQPFESIRKGMRGYGLTVFEGTQVERFPVEVIGLLPNVSPGRNLFLVRLSGDRIDITGVAAGMSGSPIYLDGQLAGALSYSWGFSTEPIAGVTPIHEMLDLLRGDGDPVGRGDPGPGAGRTPPAAVATIAATMPLSILFDPDRLADFFYRYLDRTAATGLRALVALPLPLAISGIDLPALPGLTDGLRRAGLVPVPAGVATAATGDGGVELEPGGAVAVKLTRGDFDISAIGTLTHIEGDRVLAFGHPLLNLGAIDLPMARAEVQTIIPSLQTSFKMGRALDVVGAFRQDRTPGLAGRSGAEPAMMPVRLEIDLPDRPVREYRFEVVRTPYLSPYLLYMGLNAILSSAWKDFGDATVEIQDGSTILVTGATNHVSLRNLFSGPTAAPNAAGTVAFIYYLLMGNEHLPAGIEGINLRMKYRAEPRIARIDRVWCDRGAVRPGETVTCNVSLLPYRQPGLVRRVELRIPEETAPGRLLLQVGDGLQLSRRERTGAAVLPRDLNQLVRLINHLRTNDRIYLLLTREGEETLIRGERFSGLPPSKASILLEPQVNANRLRIGERRILEESIETDFVVSGHRLLALEVR